MSKFVTGKEFRDVLENKKKITFRWPQEFESIIYVVPTLVDGKRIYYTEDWYESLMAVFEGEGINRYLKFLQDTENGIYEKYNDNFDKYREDFEYIHDTYSPTEDRLGCVGYQQVSPVNINHIGKIDTWYVNNISMFGKTPTWFDPEFTIHSKLIGDDYEIFQLDLSKDFTELLDTIRDLNCKIEIFNENDHITPLDSSFIYEKLEGDKLIENRGSNDAIHITVKSYKDKQTLFDIKQEKDEDDLHFYVRIENGRETFEYSRKIETQEDFCKALEQTINALENYSEFYEQRDELKEVLEKFN